MKSAPYHRYIIVETLNSLYSKFDDIAQTFGIEKIKTIGDAYMAACGILDEDLEHKEKMVAFAFAALEIAQTSSFADIFPISIRIGILVTIKIAFMNSGLNRQRI